MQLTVNNTNNRTKKHPKNQKAKNSSNLLSTRNERLDVVRDLSPLPDGGVDVVEERRGRVRRVEIGRFGRVHH